MTLEQRQPISEIERFSDLPVAVAARICEQTMSLAEIDSLAVGSVIRFEKATSEPLDLLAGDVKIASVTVSAAQDRLSARVLRIEAQTGSDEEAAVQ